MAEEMQPYLEKQVKNGFSGMQVLAIVLAAIFIAIIATAFVIKIFLFPGPFKPVVLTDKEEQQLSTKLALFEGFSAGGEGQEAESKKDEYKKDGSLKPEKYTEEGVSREINFTERELNAMVAKNTDLAEKLAIDLAENMVSIKLLIPLDPDFPMLGGRTLKIKAGAELAYRNQRPVIKLKGVSLMGVPMPNAWLGGIKNIDLVNEFGGDDGFWKTFGDGVKSISVVEGYLNIQLKE
jgi:hypothetical protein